MSKTITNPANPFGRSVGIKLLVVCALVLLMAIPILFISIISFERAGRADEVSREVAQRYGQAQTLSGPVLVAPYYEVDKDGEAVEGGEYIVFADTGSASAANVAVELRKRSLFKVPTYQADYDVTASFDLSGINDELPERVSVDFSRARVLVGITDVTGLRDDLYTNINGKRMKFKPMSGSVRPVIDGERHKDYHLVNRGLAQMASGQFMHVDIDASGTPKFTIKTTVPVSGTSRIGLSAFAQTTKFSVASKWPHPGFGGRFAPSERDEQKDGFSASWSVPFLARGVAAHGKAANIDGHRLSQNTMSVQLVNPVDPYRNVNRALKYGVMFIGLVFLTYFLFETMIGVRVHAAQYVLIGLAQSVFYLLLLAFSEHIGFTGAFLVAAIATVSVCALYAGTVFGARKYALSAGAVFAFVYTLLYVLMKVQDFALMIGALASFLAIAGTMYFTRDIDWYGAAKAPKAGLD